MSDHDLIAAFLSNNSVTKIPDGVRTMDEKEMFKAVRGETFKDSDKPRLATVDHLGRETWVNSEGEIISHG